VCVVMRFAHGWQSLKPTSLSAEEMAVRRERRDGEDHLQESNLQLTSDLRFSRGCCRVFFFFFWCLVAGSCSMGRLLFVSIAVAVSFVVSVADASIWSKCRTIDYISTCSSLCDVEVGARSVYFTGRVLMWNCLPSTVTVRKIIKLKK
jgi:hypothetical protein